MTINHALRFGTALAATVGIGYAACALVFAVFPEAAANFMNALFHGLDFRMLQSTRAVFSFGGFAYALVVLVVWVFAFGALFDWISGRASDSRLDVRCRGLRKRHATKERMP